MSLWATVRLPGTSLLFIIIFYIDFDTVDASRSFSSLPKQYAFTSLFDRSSSVYPSLSSGHIFRVMITEREHEEVHVQRCLGWVHEQDQ